MLKSRGFLGFSDDIFTFTSCMCFTFFRQLPDEVGSDEHLRPPTNLFGEEVECFSMLSFFGCGRQEAIVYLAGGWDCQIGVGNWNCQMQGTFVCLLVCKRKYDSKLQVLCVVSIASLDPVFHCQRIQACIMCF